MHGPTNPKENSYFPFVLSTSTRQNTGHYFESIGILSSAVMTFHEIAKLMAYVNSYLLKLQTTTNVKTLSPFI
jgi:hypothetical protein